MGEMADVLNPAELHRKCAQLDAKVRLLEKRLAHKDAERLELFQEAKLLHDEKSQALEELRQSREERDQLKKKIAEVGKVCQKLLTERHDWRGKEQQLRRQLQDRAQQDADLRAELESLRMQLARQEESCRRQDRELQHHVEQRQALLQQQREKEELAERSKRAETTQTDLDVDEQQRLLVEADAVASVGLAEARANKVEVQQLRRKVMRLEASSATANQACDTYRKAIQEQEHELEHLARDLEQLRRDSDRERGRMQQLLREAEGRERELHAAIENIRDRNMSIEDTRRELERLDGKEREGLRAQLAAAREEAAAAQDRLRVAEEAQEDQQRKHKQLMVMLQQQCAQGDEQRRGDSEEIQKLNAENREVMEEYCRVRQQRDDLRQRLQQLEDEAPQLREQAIRAEEQYSRHLSALQQEQQEKRQLQQELQGVRGQLESLQQAARQPAPGGLALPPRPSPAGSATAGPPSPAPPPQGCTPSRPPARSISSPLHPEDGRRDDEALLPDQARELRRRLAELERENASLRSAAAPPPEVAQCDALLARVDELQRQLDEKSQVIARLGSIKGTDAHDGPEGSGSPPTGLQALLRDVTQDGSDEGTAPVPPPPGLLPPELPGCPAGARQQGALALWGAHLRKLCSKLQDILEGSHRTTAFLYEKRGGGAGAAEALLAGGVPINPTSKYCDPWWNKAFELCSGIKYCTRQSQQQVLLLVTEWQMARTGLAPPPQSGTWTSFPSASGEHLMHGPDLAADPVYAPDPHHGFPPPHGYAHPPPPPHPQYQPPSLPQQQPPQYPQQEAVFSAGAGRTPAPPDSAPPRTDLDTTDTDPSQLGDDYHHCVQMITDSDALLRAAQGQQPFWGEDRIAVLQSQLAELQQEPAVPGEGPADWHSRAAAAVALAQKQQQQQCSASQPVSMLLSGSTEDAPPAPALQQPPPAGAASAPQGSPPRRTMRWTDAPLAPPPEPEPPAPAPAQPPAAAAGEAADSSEMAAAPAPVPSPERPGGDGGVDPAAKP